MMEDRPDSRTARPRQRQFAPKTRTGCKTCKIRCVKCDEKRPHCQKCTSSGRLCDGYETIRIAKPHASSAGEMVLRWETPPSQHPDTNHRELEALFHFRENLLDCTCSTWDMNVWHRLVLPMSTNEPIVRHAVVALGSLSRPGSVGDAFGLQQYGLAMKGLQGKIAAGSSPSLHLTLVACLLFVAIEFVQQGLEQAHFHLQGGLSILRENQEAPAASSTSKLNGDFAQLQQLFSRLDNQKSLFTSSRVQLNRAMGNGRMAFLPAEIHLKSIEDAGKLQNLQISAMRELVCEVESQRFTPEDITPANYAELEVQLGRQLVSLGRWHTAMQDCIARVSNARELRVGRLLMMSHLCCRMMVSNALNDGREVHLDRFMPEFEQILDLGAEVLKAEDDSPRPGQRRFSLDIGIIAPLYFTALKCRDPALRRKAIELLRASNSQEGTWDSCLMADLAGRILDVEERGLVDPSSADDVTEENRLWRAWFDLRKGSDVLYCMRRAFEQDGQWLQYEEYVGEQT